MTELLLEPSLAPAQQTASPPPPASDEALADASHGGEGNIRIGSDFQASLPELGEPCAERADEMLTPEQILAEFGGGVPGGAGGARRRPDTDADAADERTAQGEAVELLEAKEAAGAEVESLADEVGRALDIS